MSITGEKTALISRDYVGDKLYQEDDFNSDRGASSYHDHIGTDHQGSPTPGLYVEVEYDTAHLEPYVPKPNFQGKHVTFESRDKLLDHEVGRRMEAVQGLPDDQRYVGFKLSLFQKIKRLCGVNIDKELQDEWKTALKPNYSAKNVCNLTNKMSPSKAIRDQLGLESHETYRLGTKVTWAFNSSLNGYEFIDEAGRKVQIRNATTSSNDRTTPNICMMRRVDDSDTGETIAYTGRPDTKAKAIEQIEFMFRSEARKDSSVRKGLTEKDGVYTLTYAVNNLLSPVTGIGIFAFDEKGATLEEQAIFKQLAQEELMIDGKKVRVNPIYFSQPFNQTNSLTDIITASHSGKGLSKEINRTSYETLIPMAQERLETMPKGNKQELLESAIQALKGDFSKLHPEQEFFNRAVICQMLNIPLVVHCKSNTDRSLLALAAALVSHQWGKLDLDLIRNDKGQVVPHLILQNEAAKELVAGHCLAGHQVTRVSRACEGVVKGHEIGTRILGLEWSSNPIAGRILPERYTKVNDVSLGAKIGVGILSTIGCIINVALAIPIWLIGSIIQKDPFFNPIYLKPGYSPFAERLVDPKSPYVGAGKGRSLLKPEEMVSL